MTTTAHSLNLANGQQLIRVAGAPNECQQVSFACTTYPSAGTLTLEWSPPGSNVWLPVYHGALLPLVGPLTLNTQAGVAQYRVTLAGLVGGSGLSAWVSSGTGGGGIPDGAFTGLRAMTVQSYIEANVKNGVQFEASAYIPALAGGANNDTVFITGAKPVIVKSRQIGFDGSGILARVFRAPTYTGGTPVPIYNLNTVTPVTATVTGLGGSVVTAAGTEIAAPAAMIGSDIPGSATQGTYGVAGSERLLAANTTYLLRLTSLDNVAQQVSVYLTWYEGQPDLP